MHTWNRPLPGVRLDYSRQLVPECEWHISPLGRSYFVNHNTRTTSWKKPAPERPPGSLTPERVIEGHSKVILSLSCMDASGNILSASGDGSIRQWTRDGELVGKPWVSDGGAVSSMVISPDETVAVSGCADGKLRLWHIKEGRMLGDPWEGHDSQVNCLDWSPNAREIASGSHDGNIIRWNPDTGRQIAPPIETGQWRLCAVKYSPQGDKFTSGGDGNVICVWSKDGKLLMEIKGHENLVGALRWSRDGAHIFSASSDNTIRKFQSLDGKELVIFRGHTNGIHSLCLSPDGNHLVSASIDYSVRIWDLKTNQLVGNPLLHNDELWAVDISPDGKYLASAGSDAKVYLWSLEAALKQQGNDGNADESNAKLKANHASLTFVQGKDFFDTDTNPAHRPAAPASPSFGLRWRKFFGSLHFGTRPAHAPQSVPLEPQRWNFRSFPVGISRRSVIVAPCRDEDRYGITPETDAEAAAAMQRTNSNEPGSSTQPGQPQAVAGTQVSQGQPTGMQDSSGGTGAVSCEVRCCGLFCSCGRPPAHES
ncbi:WD40 repeat-like protein [Suillus brevipes Sb2]|nr:WD40 repeat-like protein [Suillus brevipes Sb2]